MGRERSWLPLALVKALEPEIRERGVSEVARSPRGFLAAYKRAGGDPDRLGTEQSGQPWRDRRNGFVARHMAQAESEALWDAQGRPSRRHLALIAWAYSPDRARLERYASGPKRNPTETLYHCGKLRPGQTFDLRFSGTGEGATLGGFAGAFGRGVYLTDNREIAQLYCKYAAEPFLTTARVHGRLVPRERRGEPGSVGIRVPVRTGAIPFDEIVVYDPAAIEIIDTVPVSLEGMTEPEVKAELRALVRAGDTSGRRPELRQARQALFDRIQAMKRNPGQQELLPRHNPLFRRNPPITAAQLYQILQAQRPDLLARLGGRDALLPVIEAELARAFPAKPEPEPAPMREAIAIPGRAIRAAGHAGAMDYATAARWVQSAMDTLAGLIPPGPDWANMEDGIGFSKSTNGPGRRWLAHASYAGGAENLRPEILLAGSEILRVHSRTQLDRNAWEAAHNAISAVTPMTAEESKKLLWTDADSTAQSGKTEKDGSWEWTGDGLELRTARRNNFSLKTRVIEAAGFKKGVDFRWKKLGYQDFVLWVAPHAVQRFADWISEAYPTLAAAMQSWAPTWLEDAAAAGVRTSDAPEPVEAVAVDLDALDPERGTVEGIKWEWSPDDRRRLLVLFPERDLSFAVGDVVTAQNAYRGRYPNTEYWRAFDAQEAPEKIADVLASNRFGLTDAAAAFRRLAPVWGHVPELSATEQQARAQRARMLTRRFRHMLDPRIRDTDAAERVLAESMPLLERVQSGDESADLGAWGSWDVVKVRKGEEIHVYTPYSMKGWSDVVRGAKVRRLPKGWGVVADVRRAPAIARALDSVNPPLAMSIRLGLLTELLGADDGRDCAALEELASARTVPEIIDPATRAKVEAINRAIPWPKGLQPYPFQRVGIGYAVLAGGRALIGDSMGLGKTIQAIGFLMHDIAATTPALVIAPTVYNWRNEIAKWSGGRLRPVVIESSRTRLPQAREGDVFLVSWGLVALVYERLLMQGFKTVVQDESHYAKNPKANRSEAARILSLEAEHRLLLSGTAMENRPIELWHQLHMIDPFTFPDKKEFGEQFANAQKRTVGGRTFWDDRGASNLDELRDTLRCFMIRRLKTEVLTELPDKTRESVWVELDPKARRAYDAVQEDMEAAICAAWRARSVKAAKRLIAEGENVVAAVRQVNAEPPDVGELSQLVIVQLGYLRRAVAEAKVPAAIQWILDFAEGGDPLLVFYEHQSTLEAVGKALNKANIAWDYIDGSVSQKKREQKVAALQDGRIQVLVGSKAMHAGWNLQRASDALFVERWWVPSQEEQAEDRMYRIGQKNAVTVRYLMANNTVDNQIAELVDGKRELIESVMRGEDVAKRRRELSPKEEETERASLSAALRDRVLARLAGECKITIADLE